jgi:hypothetical protein
MFLQQWKIGSSVTRNLCCSPESPQKWTSVPWLFYLRFLAILVCQLYGSLTALVVVGSRNLIMPEVQKMPTCYPLFQQLKLLLPVQVCYHSPFFVCYHSLFFLHLLLSLFTVTICRILYNLASFIHNDGYRCIFYVPSLRVAFRISNRQPPRYLHSRCRNCTEANGPFGLGRYAWLWCISKSCAGHGCLFMLPLFSFSFLKMHLI